MVRQAACRRRQLHTLLLSPSGHHRPHGHSTIHQPRGHIAYNLVKSFLLRDTPASISPLPPCPLPTFPHSPTLRCRPVEQTAATAAHICAARRSRASRPGRLMKPPWARTSPYRCMTTPIAGSNLAMSRCATLLNACAFLCGTSSHHLDSLSALGAPLARPCSCRSAGH